jgi:xanthine dehydrogenase YagR molybdenum-binding subunit
MTDHADYHLEGLEIPETPVPQSGTEPWTTTTVVGTARPRVDAYELVSGTAVYPSDVVLPRMLYGAILRCPHPHATVRSIDTSAASSLPGVHAVLTGAGPHHASVRDYASVLESTLPATCRYEGQAVAAVAADDPYVAADALRGITVEYDVHPFVADERRALDDDAALVHPDGNRVGEPSRSSRGDLARGFAEADVVLEESYRTECEIHVPMEYHGCVARWDGDALTLWESTQGVFSVQSAVASTLQLPLSKVRVIGHYVGGGFGSKLQMDSSTLLAALLARQTARPVKLFLTREETLLVVGNRPPANMHIRAGAKRDGTLTALEFTATGTGGAFRAGGTSLLEWLARDLYECPNVATETTDIYINAGPARPFRAPGHPQGAWALEQMMDALAAAIEMDPVEFRLKNIPSRGQARPGMPPYSITGLARCLQEGAEAFDWVASRQATRQQDPGATWKRGVGMAAGLWIAGAGGPPSTAIVKVFSDGSVNLNLGASDIGTGTKTVMAMVLAEELGIDPDAVQIEHADTGTTAYATGSGGSKTVPTESPAVRAAAVDVKTQLLALAAEDLGVDASTLAVREGRVTSTDDATVSRAFAEIRGLRRRGTVTGIGYRGPNPADKAVCPFAAQFCEVEVNTGTGEVRIVRFLGTNDSGRVMNRLTYQNQVFGGITMGIGLAMTEARILDVDQTGKMVNLNLHDYKVPTALDVPADMTCHPIDLPDAEANTTGAKGIGEPATVPTAPAIANAVYDAVGVRLTSTTLDPAHVIAALAATGKGG